MDIMMTALYVTISTKGTSLTEVVIKLRRYNRLSVRIKSSGKLTYGILSQYSKDSWKVEIKLFLQFLLENFRRCTMDLQQVINELRALLAQYSDTDIAGELKWAIDASSKLSELVLMYDLEVEHEREA
jgi:hypothetical protein